MSAVPKLLQRTSSEYLNIIRELPCSICGKSAPSDPHHLKTRIHKNDFTAVPLCRMCHTKHQNPRLDKPKEVLIQLDLWKYAMELSTRYLYEKLQDCRSLTTTAQPSVSERERKYLSDPVGEIVPRTHSCARDSDEGETV